MFRTPSARLGKEIEREKGPLRERIYVTHGRYIAVHPVEGAQVTSHWCRKLVRQCRVTQAPTTIAELSEKLHFPSETMARLVQQAFEAGWIELQPAPPLRDICSELQRLLGAGRTKELIWTALSMTRSEDSASRRPMLDDVLIAIELLLTPEETEQHGAALQALFDRYRTQSPLP